MNNLVVLIVDGIHAGLLGPYGNTWIETPGWNRAASQAWLAETMIADQLDVHDNLTSLLTATHSFCRQRVGIGPVDSWLGQAAATDMTRYLVTDSDTVAASAIGQDFDEIDLIERVDQTECCSHPNESQLARVFAGLSARLATASEPFVLVTYAEGLYGPWDAPLSYRQTFVVDDDPAPPIWVDFAEQFRPCQFLTTHIDHDELHGIRAAAGAQVMLYDLCLDTLLDQLSEMTTRHPLCLALTSCRGFGLGEHGRLGITENNLHAEMVHVPLALYDARRQPLSYRGTRIVQPADAGAYVARRVDCPISDRCGHADIDIPRPSMPPPSMGIALTLGTNACRLHTPVWTAILQGLRSPQPTLQLFVKPDDRWEQNDVADRCPGIADAFRQCWHNLNRTSGCPHTLSWDVPELIFERVG